MRASVVSDFSYFFSTKPRDWRGGNVSEVTWHAVRMGRQTTTQSINQSIVTRAASVYRPLPAYKTLLLCVGRGVRRRRRTDTT